MRKNVAWCFCAWVENPVIYGDIFGILKIRQSKQAFRQTQHYMAEWNACGGFL